MVLGSGACSSAKIKPYPIKGEPNFIIRFHGDSGFPFSKTLRVGINRITPDCKSAHLGEIKVSNRGTTPVHIPEKQSFLLVFISKESDVFASNTLQLTNEISLIPAAGAKYEIDFIHEGGSHGMETKETLDGKSRPITPIDLSQCQGKWLDTP